MLGRRGGKPTVTDVAKPQRFDQRDTGDRARTSGTRSRCTISGLLDRESRSMKRARHRAVLVTSIYFNRYNTPRRSTPPEIVLFCPAVRHLAREIESNTLPPSFERNRAFSIQQFVTDRCFFARSSTIILPFSTLVKEVEVDRNFYQGYLKSKQRCIFGNRWKMWKRKEEGGRILGFLTLENGIFIGEKSK